MKKATCKKWLAALLACTMLAATGCGGKDEESSSVSSGSESATSVSDASGSGSSEAMSGSGEAGSAVSGDASGSDVASVSVAPPEPILMSGEFLCLDEERYLEERAPLLELKQDGSFSLRLNLGDGLGTMAGTYERLGTSLTLEITERETTDYLGAEIDLLPFSVLDEDHLSYNGEPVGMTRQGDQFTRGGMPPMSIPEPEPLPEDTVDAAASGVTAGSAPTPGAAPEAGAKTQAKAEPTGNGETKEKAEAESKK